MDVVLLHKCHQIAEVLMLAEVRVQRYGMQSKEWNWE